jgi:hypothetical protein
MKPRSIEPDVWKRRLSKGSKRAEKQARKTSSFASSRGRGRFSRQRNRVSSGARSKRSWRPST